MEDLFAPAWARVDRAEALAQQMAEIWNAFVEEEPYDTELDEEGNGVYVRRVYEISPPPPELAVATGEWLYNVRSALDYVIWATAAYVCGSNPPPDEGQLQYPIYGDQGGWQRDRYRLKHLAEHHRSMLWTMQPFNSNADANYLRWINQLTRIDRHRHLNHMTAYLATIDPVLETPAGSSATLQWGQRTLQDGFVDVARFVVSPWSRGMKVQVNPRLGIDPEIEAWSESDFWKRINYSKRFRMIQVLVSAEIATYEFDCTGGSRMADALNRRIPGGV
jgi:hypothetical protein